MLPINLDSQLQYRWDENLTPSGTDTVFLYDISEMLLKMDEDGLRYESDDENGNENDKFISYSIDSEESDRILVIYIHNNNPFNITTITKNL